MSRTGRSPGSQTLADFAANTPTRLPPPTWATRWPTGGKRDVRPALPAHEPMNTNYPL
ncbi:MAG TPA: hypothetical protein VMV29_18475 [Ktedonobacterales bacterium]|nr:hypothetical protein [Ktedonobacterales bacterium]